MKFIDAINKSKEYYENFITRSVNDSNRIEGNTLSYVETYAIIFNDNTFTLKNAKPREIYEAINLKYALTESLRVLKTDDNEMSSPLIIHINEIINRNIKDTSGFRKIPVFINGADFVPCDAGNGFGWFLGQNQGGTPYAGGGACFNLAKLPYSITDTYAFNPNALRDTSTNINKNLNEYGCDDILTVGSHVSSIPIKIGDQGLKSINGDVCCYLACIGGWYPISQVSEYDASDGSKDNYLANTNAKVFLDERIVQKLDIPNNRVLLDNGIWVNSTPLIEIQNGN